MSSTKDSKITLYQACSVVFPVKDDHFIQYATKKLHTRWNHFVENHAQRGVVKLRTKNGFKMCKAVSAEEGVKQICEWAPYLVDQMMKEAKLTIQSLDLIMDQSVIDKGATAPQIQ